MIHADPLPSPAVDALRARLGGPMFLPGDDGYDAERAGFQANWRHQPDVVVGATTADDVRAGIEFARLHDLGVAVQATGHGTPVPARDGVLISTRRMTGVRVDPTAGSAWIEAGVQWKHVIDRAAPHGLAPLSGSSPHVGAVAYTLGGGIGLLARRFGFAADHVRSIEVVTADAQLRRVTAQSDPELFWALRGGRANFGVVTGLEIELVPVARIYGGGLFFDTAVVGGIVDTWRRWTTTLPEELTSSIMLIPFPDVPGVPEPLRGRDIAHVRIAYTGDAANGEQLLAPLRAAGPRVVDDVRDMPFTESHTICNDPEDPQASLAVNTMLGELDAAGIQAVLAAAGPDAPVRSIIEFRHLGGALSRRPAVPNAVAHRDAAYVVSVISPLITDDDAGPIREVHERVLAALEPWSNGPFLNFMAGGTATADQVRRAYHPADYQRLGALKAAHDPGNLFRQNHNIPPAH